MIIRTRLSFLLKTLCACLFACPSSAVYGDDVPFWRQLIEKRLEKIRAGEVNAPLLHRRQIGSLQYVHYRPLEGGAAGDSLHVALPEGDELDSYRKLAEENESEALVYLDELYGRRDDLKALAVRDSDGDGIPDYRISDYFGKFLEGDLDVDGDGVRNLFDSDPYDAAAGGRDSDGDGVPDVRGTFTDVNDNGLPDHLDWTILKENQSMADIQQRLFAQYKIILVDRDASFDLAVAQAADDAVNRVLRAYFEQSPVLPTLRTIAVEKTALLGKLLAAVVADNTSAQVFSQSQSLTIYDAGRQVPYDIGLLGLLVHELGHSYHMSLDYDPQAPIVENGRTDFPAPNFVTLIAPFGWSQQTYYYGEFADTLPISPRFAYTGISEPLFHFKGLSPEQWDEWVWTTYDELGQPPDYLEHSSFSQRAIVSDYSLTSPYEWYGDSLLAYLVLELEQELLANLAGEGREEEVVIAKQRITEGIRTIWPGFYHRNIAPEVAAYFKHLFPIRPEDRAVLTEKYLLPLIEN